jgi:hypothetical protein
MQLYIFIILDGDYSTNKRKGTKKRAGDPNSLSPIDRLKETGFVDYSGYAGGAPPLPNAITKISSLKDKALLPPRKRTSPWEASHEFSKYTKDIL